MEYVCTKCGYVGPSGPEHQGCNYHAAGIHSEMEYRDLLQSHASLCGKIEELKDDLRKKDLQNDEYRKALEEIARIDAKDYAMFGPRVALVAVQVAKKALSEKRKCEKRVPGVNAMCLEPLPCKFHG